MNKKRLMIPKIINFLRKKTKHKPWFFYKKRKWTAGFGDVLFPKLPEFARSPGLQGRPWTHLLRFQGSSRSNLLPVSVNPHLFAHNWARGPALPSPARCRSSATTAMARVSCWFCQSQLMLFPQWNNTYSPKYFPSRASPGKIYLSTQSNVQVCKALRPINRFNFMSTHQTSTHA